MFLTAYRLLLTAYPRARHERHKESGACLFRRAGHLGDPEVAAGHLRLRSGDLHRRHRPGRRARARAEFVRDFVFPMFRANAIYEGEYLLGTSIARPLIAQRLVEIAKKTSADAIAHGATGKGNDQVRFELGAYALMPDVRIIAPWREWDLLSRDKLLRYAEKHRIPVDFKKKKGGAPYSMDANLLHISYEGGVLEDPQYEPDESMWRITVSAEKAPSRPEYVEL